MSIAVRSLAILALIGAAACGRVAPDGPSPRSGPFAVAGFGGVLLDNDYQEVFTPAELDVESAQLLGLAGSARVARPFEALELSLEAQLVRHVHLQTHWELNAPVATARWTAFPWDAYFDTSAAFGLGLSVTSETPRLERRNEGSSQPLMAYWMFEIALALPAEQWEVLGRLHHRSTAYGTFGEDGGANALVLGLRRRF